MTPEIVVSRGKVGIGVDQKLSTLTVQARSSFPLSGTVAKTASSASLSGSGTAFLTELGLGDRIEVPGGATETRTVVAISSDTAATVDADFANTASGQVATAFPAIARLVNATGTSQVLVRPEGKISLGDLVAFDFENGETALVDLCTSADTEIMLGLRRTNAANSAWAVLSKEGDDDTTLEFAYRPPDGSLLDFDTIVKLERGSLEVAGVIRATALRLGSEFVDSNVNLAGFPDFILADAGVSGITLTLPPAVDSGGDTFVVQKIAGAGSVTIAPDGSDQNQRREH